MKISRRTWGLAGLIAGATGLATSYFVAMALSIREAPLVAVAELVIRYTPGGVTERAIQLVGDRDKPLLLAGILLFISAVFILNGLLTRRGWWIPTVVYACLAGLGVFAVMRQRSATVVDVLPVAVGFVTWLVAHSVLTEPLRRAQLVGEQLLAYDPDAEKDIAPVQQRSRRGFLTGAMVMTGAVVLFGALGRVIGAGRREVEEVRRLLKLSGVSSPRVPAAAVIDVKGISSWMTPTEEFYLIHTEFTVPTIDPKDWSLRIHGMVEKEVVLTYDDLVARELIEAWVTLNCVSNPVGGELIGNAWWSGISVADLLAEVGIDPEADAVLQTSNDGWTCGTPLVTLTDSRDAMLAISMNGKPLPIEHGFPVRTIVPGLYGYVSACKWVVDWEVTRFSDFEAFWTGKGWGEQGPVKMASRVDVPGDGQQISSGDLRIGGVAWAQHTGISRVEYALDGGEWQEAEISAPPTNDTWVQWAATVEVADGDHTLRVRATDKLGLVQTGVERDVLPDGSTGWHTIGFSASA